MKYYHYFVSFVYNDQSGKACFGSCQYYSVAKIQSFADIQTMQSSISEGLAKKLNMKDLDLSPMNYQLIREEPY